MLSPTAGNNPDLSQPNTLSSKSSTSGLTPKESTADTNNNSNDHNSSGNEILPASSPDLLKDESIAKVINSDIGFDVLLGRLKQSINMCEELSRFVKKKGQQQDEFDIQTKKLSRHLKDALNNTSKELKKDSFTEQLEELVSFDDKLTTIHASYSTALYVMADELTALATTISKQRKQVKDDGRKREKDAFDATQAAEKAKSRYNQLWNDLEKLQSTDLSKKSFTLKGSKTGTQQEEELKRKIENADNEYKSRVVTAQRLQQELTALYRPVNCKHLKELILEIDVAMSVQLQKYATWHETLVMQSGVLIAPVNPNNKLHSMRAVAASIDNEKDLYSYIMKYQSKAVVKKLSQVEYKPHGPSVTEQYSSSAYQRQQNFNNRQQQQPLPQTHQTSVVKPPTSPYTPQSSTIKANNFSTSIQPQVQPQVQPQAQVRPPDPYTAPPYLPTVNTQLESSMLNGPRPISPGNNLSPSNSSGLPPGTAANPITFGTSIDLVVELDGEMVPNVVTKCIEVIDEYGIELEGIYRTNGNASKVQNLRELIDQNPANISLITPSSSSMEGEIYCVASLLKLYFASLPEPLLTRALYPRFMEAAKIQQTELREKRLHQAVFDLPDGSYWTLRSLVFHLLRVQKKQDINRMSARNLGIVWGPTLLPSDVVSAGDMSYQGKVIEEIMLFANDIFEPEE